MITKKKKPSKIFITRVEFSSRHYLGVQMTTDMYYVAVANKILPILQEHLAGFPGLTTNHFKELALMLTCYVEDLVSQHGVWSAFVRLYRSTYKKDFPIYTVDPDNFIEDEPDFEAVRFLLWYRLNDVNPETIISPAADYLITLAAALITPLFEAYDAAPDTPGRVMFRPEEDIKVPFFIQVRNYCSWLLRECYLTKSMRPESFVKEATDFFKELFQDSRYPDDMFEYAVTSFLPFNVKTGPLALTPLEWLKGIMDFNHADDEKQLMPLIRTAESLPYQFYHILSIDGAQATIEDVDHKQYVLSADSLSGSEFPKEMTEDTASFASIVRFGDLWIINGASMSGMPADAFDKACDHYEKRKKEVEDNYEAVLERLGGKRLGVVKGIDDYVSLFNIDNDTASKNKESREIYRELQSADNLTYFVNTDSNVSMIPDVAQSIDIPGNKFYDPEYADGFNLIMDREVAPVELSEYLIEHNIVPGAALKTSKDPEIGHRIFQDNIRFFFNFTLRNTCIFQRTR